MINQVQKKLPKQKGEPKAAPSCEKQDEENNPFLGDVAQLARALDWQSRGRGFESHLLHVIEASGFLILLALSTVLPKNGTFLQIDLCPKFTEYLALLSMNIPQIFHFLPSHPFLQNGM